MVTLLIFSNRIVTTGSSGSISVVIVFDWYPKALTEILTCRMVLSEKVANPLESVISNLLVVSPFIRIETCALSTSILVNESITLTEKDKGEGVFVGLEFDGFMQATREKMPNHKKTI
ncbi:MAG: hypothetical protein Fur0022_38830 [Anaerolineales bacterium]